ncbi:hypothetical protein [Amycolatopsis sp. NPDC058986]|uniref:hypothetical protein n=1 Tax=Actinomycetes TaxID=1760 RepID=UPI00366CA6F5
MTEKPQDAAQRHRSSRLVTLADVASEILAEHGGLDTLLDLADEIASGPEPGMLTIQLRDGRQFCLQITETTFPGGDASWTQLGPANFLCSGCRSIFSAPESHPGCP